MDHLQNPTVSGDLVQLWAKKVRWPPKMKTGDVAGTSGGTWILMYISKMSPGLSMREHGECSGGGNRETGPLNPLSLTKRFR